VSSRPFTGQRRTTHSRRHAEAGFTLAELLAVVTIVGILAVLGVSALHQHVHSSKSVEAYSMIQSIRAAQERWKAETQRYFDVSATKTYYPMTDPSALRYPWARTAAQHTDALRWKLLNPTAPNAVQFGYKVSAGAAGTTMTVPNVKDAPALASPDEPWYVIEAAEDLDNDGKNTIYAATSLSGEVYVQPE
jgi:prepilin-type N-terminal cleavage/methylation domain-containing protein